MTKSTTGDGIGLPTCIDVRTYPAIRLLEQVRWLSADRSSVGRLLGHKLPGWTSITISDGTWIAIAPDRTVFEVR